MEVGFTSKIETFIAHDGLKFSYTKQALGNELYIRSNELLFEQGIDYVDISMAKWEDIPCFFQTNPTAELPFDIFAAGFYLISRYEEYLPHVKDDFERFPAEESLAFQNKFLDKPVIDLWAYKFRDKLLQKFPDFESEIFHKERKFQFISTIDVDIAYKYKNKGIIRTFGGLIKDLSQFKMSEIGNRLLVIFGLRKDPFDIFNHLISMHKKYNVKSIFFFLMSEYTSYDKNTSVGNLKYKLLIKNVADYVKVGIHPSYYSMKDEHKMKKEKRRLEEIVNFPINKSRQHYLRVDLPETYQKLVDIEVGEDYTMGFASYYGFRAGTCTPFYFYDIDFEIQTPLKVFPYAVMDGTLKEYLKYSQKKSLDTILNLANEVKKVNGIFITLFHNESISGTGQWRGWGRLYENVLKEMSKKDV
jgi:hypothetical protein